MKRLLIENNRKFLVMTFCLLTISCGNSNDNYPQDYVGFKYALRKILIGCNQTEFETEFKIIAAQKTDYARTVVLTTPGSSLGSISASTFGKRSHAQSRRENSKHKGQDIP